MQEWFDERADGRFPRRLTDRRYRNWQNRYRDDRKLVRSDRSTGRRADGLNNRQRKLSLGADSCCDSIQDKQTRGGTAAEHEAE